MVLILGRGDSGIVFDIFQKMQKHNNKSYVNNYAESEFDIRFDEHDLFDGFLKLCFLCFLIC